MRRSFCTSVPAHGICFEAGASGLGNAAPMRRPRLWQGAVERCLAQGGERLAGASAAATGKTPAPALCPRCARRHIHTGASVVGTVAQPLRAAHQRHFCEHESLLTLLHLRLPTGLGCGRALLRIMPMRDPACAPSTLGARICQASSARKKCHGFRTRLLLRHCLLRIAQAPPARPRGMLPVLQTGVECCVVSSKLRGVDEF